MSEVAIVNAKVRGFIKKKSDHKMRKRRMDSYAENAISILAQIAANQGSTDKDRVCAANAILDYQLALYRDDSKDEITRLELQCKYEEELARNLTTQDEDDDDNLPQIDFSSVIEVD